METEPQRQPEAVGWNRSSIQIEIAQRFAFGRVLGFAQGLGKFLFKQVFLVLFRVHGLPEDGLLALVLLTHRLGSGFEVLEHAFAGSWGVTDYKPAGSIDPDHGPAIGAGYFENFFLRTRHNTQHFRP